MSENRLAKGLALLCTGGGVGQCVRGPDESTQTCGWADSRCTPAVSEKGPLRRR